MIVLAASVLIAYLDAEDFQHEPAEAMLAREIDDEFATGLHMPDSCVLLAAQDAAARVAAFDGRLARAAGELALRSARVTTAIMSRHPLVSEGDTVRTHTPGQFRTGRSALDVGAVRGPHDSDSQAAIPAQRPHSGHPEGASMSVGPARRW